MNLRFAALLTGCMVAGGAAAAYYRADIRPVAHASLASAEELPPPLFMQAALGAPATASPPVEPIAFYDEMFALVQTGPAQHTPQAPARGAAADGGDPAQAALAPPPTLQTAATPTPLAAPAPQVTPPAHPAGAGGMRPPANNDMVEIVIRDRFGRPIRVERVDRRLLAARGYPQPPYRRYAPQSYGHYGPYGPYGSYGPYR